MREEGGETEGWLGVTCVEQYDIHFKRRMEKGREECIMLSVMDG